MGQNGEGKSNLLRSIVQVTGNDDNFANAIKTKQDVTSGMIDAILDDRARRELAAKIQN